MLNEKKIDYFRKLLRKKLSELQEQSERPSSELGELTTESPDFADQASMESDLDLTLHIREREAKLISKIEEALTRIEEGTFGTCEECGEDISEKRLKARPVTTLCINCKRQQENQEKLRGL
jgi:DnaK suppressor protein